MNPVATRPVRVTYGHLVSSLIALALIAAGLAISVYLTVEYYSASSTLACPNTGALNCQKVATSQYAKFLGVPVALLGLLYFLTLIPFHLPASWRSQNRWLHWVRAALALGGVVMVCWLIYVEMFKLSAICLWCTGIHVVTFALFVLTALGTASWDE